METTINTGISPEYSLLQQKLNELNTPHRAKRNYSDSEKTQLAETVRGFESIFVNMMYKSMKSAQLDTLKDNETKEIDFGADTLSGYTDMVFADQIANTGTGIGLAAMMYQQITGDKLEAIATPIKLAPASGKSLIDAIIPQKETPAPVKPNTPITPIFNLSGNNTDTSNSGNLIDRVNKRISNYENTIESAANKYNLPIPLIKAVITTESAGNPTAKSTVGAKGLMQLMDATAKDLGVTNSYDPHQNIMGGAKYLRQMLDTFGGNLDHAIAAYNAGPGNVRKYGGIPPFTETQAYVKKVKGHLNSFSNV
jgi:Rod binding domain-containing protein